MRVAVLSHTYVVAANRGKLHALQRLGHRVLLISPAVWPEPDFGAITFESESRLSCELLSCQRAGHVRKYSYPFLQLRHILRTWRPDVLLAETEPGGVASWQTVYTSALLGIPLVPFAWENLPLHGRSRLAVWPVYRRARRLLVGSFGAAKTARAAGYRGPITIIPQVGVDLSLLPDKKKTTGNKSLHALFIGRLDHKKGPDILVSALAQPAAKRWRATLVGDGDLSSSLSDQIKRENLADRAVLHGAVSHDRVPQLFTDADALVLPSRTIPGWAEQFGHVLAWSMAAGVPVVATKCGAIPEVVGDAGILVPENDPEAVAEALRQLDSAQLRKKLGEAGRKRALARYSDQAIARRLGKALSLALENSDAAIED